MKNYKTLLIVFAFTLIINNLFAQGVYVNINVGYGLKMSSQNLENFDFYNKTTGANSYTKEQIFVSLGKGLNFGATLGDTERL